MSLSFSRPSKGTELALHSHPRGSPSGQTIPGRDQDSASWECAQGLFPWFLWEKIQKETEGSWHTRVGPGPAVPSREAPGALATQEIPLRPKGRFGPSVGPREGWLGLAPFPCPSFPRDSHCIPAPKFHGNFGSQILSKGSAGSQSPSAEIHQLLESPSADMTPIWSSSVSAHQDVSTPSCILGELVTGHLPCVPT